MYYTTFSAFNSHRPPYRSQTIKVAYDPTNRRGTHKSATNQHNPKTSLRNDKQAEMLRVVNNCVVRRKGDTNEYKQYPNGDPN